MSTVEIVIKGKDQASGAFDSANKSAGGLSGTLSKIAGPIVKAGLLAAAGAAAAIGAGLATCIGPASDLNETVSKVGIVFGKQADKVLKFGDTAAMALGMSKNAALAAAATYGNLFTSMGMTEDASAGMSMSLVDLASDLASFNNMAPEEVLEKLRAGLTGETEPLKSLGVNLNEATIKAKAMAMGLYSGKGALDAAAKAQASYALIMEQTGKAQGDFERTSQGYANQQRILGATMEDLRAKVGTPLLGMMNKLLGVVLKFANSPQFQKWLDNLTAGLGRAADAVGRVIDIFSGEDGLAGAFNNVLPGLIAKVGEFGAGLISKISEAIPGILAWLQELGGRFSTWIIDAIPGMLAAAGELGAQLITWITGALPGLLAAFGTWVRAAIGWVLEALPGVLAALGDLLQKLIGALMANLPKWMAALLKFGLEMIQWIVAQLPGLAENLGKFFNKMVNWVMENLPGWIKEMQKFAMKAIDWVLEALPGLSENLGKMAGTLLKWILQTAIDVVPKLLVMAGKFLLWVATDVLPKLPGVLAGILTAILKFIGGMITAINPEIGKVAKGIIDSLAEGIRKAADVVGRALSDVVNWAIDAIKRRLGMSTNSAKGMGMAMAQGIASGLVAGLAQIRRDLPGMLGPLAMPLRLTPVLAGAIPGMAGQQMRVISGEYATGADGGPAPVVGRVISTPTEYHLHIHSSASTENLVADFAMLKAMAG